MAAKSIFDCEFEASSQSTRQLISYDEDLFAFDSETATDDVDGTPTNLNVSVTIDCRNANRNGKRKANFELEKPNGTARKKSKSDLLNIKVSTNGRSRQVFESRTRQVVDGSSHSDEYTPLNIIGCGTYGEVFKARWNTTGETIAVKRLNCKLNTNDTDGQLEFMRREYDNLLELRDCPYIVQILKSKERQVSKNDLQVDFLLEYCPHNLKRIIENTTISFQLSEIKMLLRQMLFGLQYMHDKSIMHRDFKTENILLTIDGNVKIADFGLSRKITDPDASLEPEKYTPNMCTQWYRAPEILLGDRHYNEAVDMWSFACIIGEFWYRQAILRGENEIQQIKLISNLCGSLKPETWPNIVNLRGFQQASSSKLFQNHQPRGTRSFLKHKVPMVKDEHVNIFFDKMLQCNPDKRLNAYQALNENFFYTSPLPARNLERFMARNKHIISKLDLAKKFN